MDTTRSSSSRMPTAGSEPADSIGTSRARSHGSAAIHKSTTATVTLRSNGRSTGEGRIFRSSRAVRDSLLLSPFCSDTWYGDIAIAQEGEKLVMRFSHTPDFVGDLEHWQYDTFAARWRNRELRADAFVTFSLTP